MCAFLLEMWVVHSLNLTLVIVTKNKLSHFKCIRDAVSIQLNEIIYFLITNFVLMYTYIIKIRD